MGDNVRIPDSRKLWPHEKRVADILAANGHKVVFLQETKILKSADILLDGAEFEIKSPVGSNIKAVERNVSRGSKQSKNIVFDSSRMKKIRDDQIKRELIACLKRAKGVDKIIFITKSGKCVDIDL